MSLIFYRPTLSRRWLTGGLLGAAALALGAIAPVAPVEAESAGGLITFTAHVCESPAEELLACPFMHPGALTLVHEDGVEVLTMDESVQYGNSLVWGETSPVQTGTYYLATDYLTVPDGYKLWDFVADYGVVSGSDLGWYVSTTADVPDASFAAIYVPIDVDTDGDGASDDVEMAAGSDPLDPNSYPEGVQAGPEPDSDGDGAYDDIEVAYGSDPYDAADYPAPIAGSDSGASEYVVTRLPNTGAGAADTKTAIDSSLMTLLGGGFLALAGAAVALRRRNA